eukprot:UN25621
MDFRDLPCDDVASQFPNKTSSDVRLKWLNDCDPRVNFKKWTQAEIDALNAACAKYSCKNWLSIAGEVGKRTPLQCYRKYRELDVNRFKQDWTKAEDQLLTKVIYQFGEKEWKLMSNEFKNPLRTWDQLLHRWTRTADLNIDQSTHSWTSFDDFKLVLLVRYFTSGTYTPHQGFPPLWNNLIVEHFPHKTDRKIRERWKNVIV